MRLDDFARAVARTAILDFIGRSGLKFRSLHDHVEPAAEAATAPKKLNAILKGEQENGESQHGDAARR